MKSGSLNLLEPSGPVLACNGIALPLLLCVYGYLVILRKKKKNSISVTTNNGLVFL